MSVKTKYKTILDTMIDVYLETGGPVSSMAVAEKLPFEISSAAIRYYFQKMTERNELTKRHKSSGRVPTAATLAGYWRRRVEKLTELFAEDPENLFDRYRLYCVIKPFETNRLVEVDVFRGRYVVALFEKGEFIVPHSEALERYLKELVGYRIDEVRWLLKSVGMTMLALKMGVEADREIRVYGVPVLMYAGLNDPEWGRKRLCSFMEGWVINDLQNGLYFEPVAPRGHLALQFDIKKHSEKIRILCVGPLDRNYELFDAKTNRLKGE